MVLGEDMIFILLVSWIWAQVYALGS